MSAEGKVAVVTGASRGIGKGIAIQLAKSGFDVVVAARSVQDKEVTPWPGTIHETADLVRKEGRRALPVRMDVTNMDDVRGLIDQSMKEFGRIDVMVNNAVYVDQEQDESYVDTDWEKMELRVKGNILAPLLVHKLCIPIMIKQGGGIFLNVTSLAGVHGYVYWDRYLPGRGSSPVPYAVTKAGFNRIAAPLAWELQEHNIVVVNLSPPFTLIERLLEKDAAPFDLGTGHSVWVTAVAAAYLATCRNPMYFSGKNIETKELVEELGLMTPEEMESPVKG